MFLNWAFTDTPAGTATTIVFAEGDALQPLVQIAGPGTVDATGGVVTGGNCNNNNAGSVTFRRCLWIRSVAGCAFATQQYFATDGSWKTRITPIGHCENIVVDAPAR